MGHCPLCYFRELKLDKFGKYVKNMDDSVRHLLSIGESNSKKHQGRKYDLFGMKLKILRLEYLQNSAALIVTNTSRFSSITQICEMNYTVCPFCIVQF